MNINMQLQQDEEANKIANMDVNQLEQQHYNDNPETQEHGIYEDEDNSRFNLID